MRKRYSLSFIFMTGLTLFAALQFACPESPSPEPIALQSPLHKIRFHGISEVFLTIMDDAELGDVCNLELFAGLRTGMTSPEVAEILGPRQQSSKERSGRDDVSSFPREGGYLDVVRQHVYDSEGDDAGYRWFLRARPTDRRLETHLAAEVLDAISTLGATGSYSLVIENAYSTTRVVIDGFEVTSILLLADESREVSEDVRVTHDD